MFLIMWQKRQGTKRVILNRMNNTVVMEENKWKLFIHDKVPQESADDLLFCSDTFVRCWPDPVVFNFLDTFFRYYKSVTFHILSSCCMATLRFVNSLMHRQLIYLFTSSNGNITWYIIDSFSNSTWLHRYLCNR